jgi:hypothetical protein
VTVLLTYRGRDGRWRAGDGIAAPPKLADGEGGSKWLAGDVEDTNGAVDLGEALGLLKGAMGTMIQCGDEERRELGLWQGKLDFRGRGSIIYRVFGLISCTTRRRSQFYL